MTTNARTKTKTAPRTAKPAQAPKAKAPKAEAIEAVTEAPKAGTTLEAKSDKDAQEFNCGDCGGHGLKRFANGSFNEAKICATCQGTGKR